MFKTLLTIISIIIPGACSQCPPEYIPYKNESCFVLKYFDPQVSMYEAEQFCNTIGGSVLSIDDEVQEEWIFNTIFGTPPNETFIITWLGLVRNVSNNDQWVWLDDNQSQYKH